MPGTVTRPSLFAYSRAALRAELLALGEKPFRADQILQWLYRRRVASFAEMTDLPAPLRRRLAETFTCGTLCVQAQQRSGQSRTTKFLLALPEGDAIEAVYLEDGGRVTYCLSSQVGCPLGCTFCATGYAGFRRNLTDAEILEQAHILARTLGPPRNVVFMGMGEPLLNVEAVMGAVRGLTDPHRFGLSARRITVSTVGIVPGMDRLAELRPPVRLALSLHAPTDRLREELVPINRRYPLAEVLAACKRYLRATGRILTLEYVMIGEVNLEPEHALGLASIARELAAKVNLLAWNPVAEAPFRPPTTAEQLAFRDRLRALGVPVTIRYRRGRDIQAACGQLRGRLAPRRRGGPRRP